MEVGVVKGAIASPSVSEATVRALVSGAMLKFNLAGELEGRAASLRKEALLSLTGALHNTPQEGFMNFLTETFSDLKTTDAAAAAPPRPDTPTLIAQAVADGMPPLEDDVPPEEEEEWPTDPSIRPKNRYRVIRPSDNMECPDVYPRIYDCAHFFPPSQEEVATIGIPKHDISERFYNERGLGHYFCEFFGCPISRYNLSSIAAHVRRSHLGICLACPICFDRDLKWFTYSSDAWQRHMRDRHYDYRDQWFRVAGAGL